VYRLLVLYQLRLVFIIFKLFLEIYLFSRVYPRGPRAWPKWRSQRQGHGPLLECRVQLPCAPCSLVMRLDPDRGLPILDSRYHCGQVPGMRLAAAPPEKPKNSIKRGTSATEERPKKSSLIGRLPGTSPFTHGWVVIISISRHSQQLWVKIILSPTNDAWGFSGIQHQMSTKQYIVLFHSIGTPMFKVDEGFDLHSLLSASCMVCSMMTTR
jgi:hypothetical protein